MYPYEKIRPRIKIGAIIFCGAFGYWLGHSVLIRKKADRNRHALPSLAVSSRGKDAALSRLRPEFKSPYRYQRIEAMKHRLFGNTIEPGDINYCRATGSDHRGLVEEARNERRRLEKDVDNSSVICARCVRAIPLKV